MRTLQDTYSLTNGVQIPSLGFGTWQMADGPETVRAVRLALEAGYRHIDTAAAYRNEGSVRKALEESGLPREDVFITTKLQNSDHGYDATHKGFKRSLAFLGLAYVDLYLIHWPNPIKFRDNWQEANAGSWRAMEELYEAGQIRSIGVSNFRRHHLEALQQTARLLPMVNQIRLCPGDEDLATIQASRDLGLLVEAYSPLGNGLVFDVPQLRELAREKGRTVAQVCLRWSLQKGYCPLPKSVTAERIIENSHLFDFDLTEEDMARIDQLAGCCGSAEDPDTAQF